MRPQEQDVHLVQFGRVLPFDYWNGLAEPRKAAITTAPAMLQGVVVLGLRDQKMENLGLGSRF